MKVETRNINEGTEIFVEVDTEIAVVVNSEEERIYLPESEVSDTTYYVEDVDSLVETENGYRVVYPGEIHREDVKVLGN